MISVYDVSQTQPSLRMALCSFCSPRPSQSEVISYVRSWDQRKITMHARQNLHGIHSLNSLSVRVLFMLFRPVNGLPDTKLADLHFAEHTVYQTPTKVMSYICVLHWGQNHKHVCESWDPNTMVPLYGASITQWLPCMASSFIVSWANPI